MQAMQARDVLLVLLAVGAGVVDAISLTSLGVFTAAVTANIVLVGLALGDADVHTAVRAGLAFAGFAAGVLVAARALGRTEGAEARPLRAPAVLASIAAVQAAFLVGWLASDGDPSGIMLDLLTCASALAMGGQTGAAGVWHRGIPPTYVSGVLTLLLSDLARSGGWRPDALLRIGVIAAVVGGATLGAVMLTHAHDAVAVVPLAVTTLVAIGTAARLR